MQLQITLHPATVHFPIALLSLASVCGLLYIYWRPLKEFVVLTWWSMFIGWISGAVGIGSGLLAQSGLPVQSPYTRLLNWHIGTALATMVAYGILLYWRWLRRSGRERTQSGPAQSERAAEQSALASDSDPLLADVHARIWVTLLLLSGLLILLASGWSGGRLVYTWGVNVLP